MGATMLVADAIEPFDRQRQRRDQVMENTVFLMMVDVLPAVAVLSIIEALVLDLPTTLRNVIQPPNDSSQCDTAPSC